MKSGSSKPVEQSEVDRFKETRQRLSKELLAMAGLTTKRFLSLDGQAYRDGALPAKTKEMLGLIASVVLHCDDCISYHLIRCSEEGVSTPEMDEIFSIAMIVGGSITIPHIRRAADVWHELVGDSTKPDSGGAGE